MKYEAVQRRPEVGIGLFVKASERYRAGEIIMVDYPTMIIPSGVVDSISLNTLNDLRWKALLQVPDQARFRTRDLAQSKGRFMDEIVNIFETNAFTHSKGGALHDIIFPEASVCISLPHLRRHGHSHHTPEVHMPHQNEKKKGANCV